MAKNMSSTFFADNIFVKNKTPDIACDLVIQEAVKEILADIIAEIQTEYRQKAIAAGRCKVGVPPPPLTFIARDLSKWVVAYYNKYSLLNIETDPNALDAVTGEPKISAKFLELYSAGLLTNTRVLGKILKRFYRYLGVGYAGLQNNRQKYFLNELSQPIKEKE